MIDPLLLAEKLSNLDASDLLQKVLKRSDVQAFIVNLNTEDQLKDRNVNALGVKLYVVGGEYSITTQFLKGVPAKNIDLYDTGDYYESFEVIPLKNGDAEITSNKQIHGADSGLAEDRWGDPEGLIPENEEKAKVFIESRLIMEIEKLF